MMRPSRTEIVMARGEERVRPHEAESGGRTAVLRRTGAAVLATALIAATWRGGAWSRARRARGAGERRHCGRHQHALALGARRCRTWHTGACLSSAAPQRGTGPPALLDRRKAPAASNDSSNDSAILQRAGLSAALALTPFRQPHSKPGILPLSLAANLSSQSALGRLLVTPSPLGAYNQHGRVGARLDECQQGIG